MKENAISKQLQNAISNMAFKSILVVILLVLQVKPSDATNPLPQGAFSKDSIKLGEEIFYVLTYEHPADMEIVFPDSTYDFAPFEYIDRAYFPTKTDSTGSVDSVVYTLMTFELDKLQKLAIPVIEMKENGEPVNIFPETSQVHLVEVIEVLPDSVNLFENTHVAHVKKEFNYPYFLIATGFLVVVGVIIFVFFGKPIKKAYRLRRLKKQNLKFILGFDKLVYGSIDKSIVEEALISWKAYVGPLVALPLLSYTTKDVSKEIPDREILHDSLKSMDKAIYAGVMDEKMKECFLTLKSFAQEAYEKKIEEVKND